MKRNFNSWTRRFFACVVCGVFAVSVVWAERVSQEDAALVANNFMNVASSSAHGQKAPAKRMVMKATAAAEENQFYIYENADGEGWVMVAANDVVRPILAYSETGYFRTDNMPVNVKGWLTSYNKQIKHVAETSSEVPEEVKSEWKKLRSGARRAKASVVVSPLIKTGWSQSAPYYNMCPMDGSKLSVTGCVATAMAQVMNYHQWPKQGTGSHSLTVKKTTYTVNFGETTYDWDNMLDHYTALNDEGNEYVISGLTTAQKNAVATLMYHCGISCDMEYTADVSGAYTIDYNGYWSKQGIMCAETALKNFFNYKVTGYCRDGNSNPYMKKWSKSDWKAMLKAELDEARPIMYAGVGCDDPNDNNTCYGHSFVCDGYDSSDLFHFNFGWTNWCDGYYEIDALDTKDPGTGGGNGSYSLEQDVILLQPNITGHSVTKNATGCSISSASVAENNKAFTATIEPTDATYDFKSITVKLGSTTLSKTTHYTLSNDNKTLTIKASAITGDNSNDLTITAVWTKNRYSYEMVYSNCTGNEDGMVAKNAALNLTITPESGYTLANAACWEVEMGGSELTYGTGFTYNASNNTFNIASVTGDVVILASAEKQVTWMADGSTFATTLTSSDKYVLPENKPEACDDTEFVGWCAEANYESETTAPTFIKDGDAATQGTTLYAVFATKGSGSGYSSIVKATSIAAGDEVILVYETGKMELTSFSETSTVYGIGSAYTTTPSGSFSFKVVAGNAANSFAFVRDGKYWNYSGSSNSLNTAASLSNNTSWTVSFSSGNATIKNVAATTRTIRWNTNSPRFACYTSGQADVQLYKKVGGGASYTDYTTSCGTPAEKYAININTPAHGSLTTSPVNEAAAGKTVTITATADTHYHLATLTVKDANNADVPVSGEGNTRTFTMPEKAVTISATFAEDTKYTINFYVGNGIQKTENLFAGQTATPPSVVAPCEAYTYTSGWVTSAITEETTSAPTYVTSFTVSGTQNYYAVFSKTEEGESGSGAIEDKLTNSTIGVGTSSTYSDWSGKTGKSGAVYAGQSAGENTTIQLRSKNSNSGIITTTSGGKVTKVTVEWNSKTTSGRVLDIYGKNSAYSAATDLYGTNAGTKLGSITYGTSTELAITGDYTYIGVRSNDGALYLTSITFTWGSGSSSTTYYTTAPSCEACTAAVTITKGTAKHGSFSIDKVGEQSTCGEALVVTVSNIEPASGYRFKEITQEGIEDAIIDQDAKTVTYAKKANGASTINVVFDEIPSYTVLFIDNGSVISQQDVLEGESANKPSDPTPDCNEYTFVGWWTSELAATNTEAKEWVSDFTITGEQKYYAIYSKTEEGESGSGAVEDKLTNSTIGVGTSSTYSDWSGKTVNSDAVYAGQSAGENTTIQLRSKNSNSGIITTTSGGKVTKVTVEWNSSTTDGRILDIYGKNSAYSAATDLYGTNAGTKLGSITYGTSTELSITDDYTYIGVRSNNGALYLTSITFTWGSGSSSTTYYSSAVSCSETPTELVNMGDNNSAVQKILRNGQLLIIRDGKTYNIMGNSIK